MTYNVEVVGTGKTANSSPYIHILAETLLGEVGSTIDIKSTDELDTYLGYMDNMDYKWMRYLLEYDVPIRVTSKGKVNAAGDDYIGTRGSASLLELSSTPTVTSFHRNGQVCFDIDSMFVHDGVVNQLSDAVVAVNSTTGFTAIVPKFYRISGNYHFIVLTGDVVAEIQAASAAGLSVLTWTGSTYQSGVLNGTYTMLNTTPSLSTAGDTWVRVSPVHSTNYYIVTGEEGSIDYVDATNLTSISVAGDLTANYVAGASFDYENTATGDVFTYTVYSSNFDGTNTIVSIASYSLDASVTAVSSNLVIDDTTTQQYIEVAGLDLSNYLNHLYDLNISFENNENSSLTATSLSAVGGNSRLVFDNTQNIQYDLNGQLCITLHTKSVLEFNAQQTAIVTGGIYNLESDQFNGDVDVVSANFADGKHIVKLDTLFTEVLSNAFLYYPSGAVQATIQSKFFDAESANFEVTIRQSVDGVIGNYDIHTSRNGIRVDSVYSITSPLTASTYESVNDKLRFIQFDTVTTDVNLVVGVSILSAGSRPTLVETDVIDFLRLSKPFDENTGAFVYISENPDATVLDTMNDEVLALNAEGYVSLPLRLSPQNEIAWKVALNREYSSIKAYGGTLQYQLNDGTTFWASGLLFALQALQNRSRLQGGAEYWSSLGYGVVEPSDNGIVQSFNNYVYSADDKAALKNYGLNVVTKEGGVWSVANHVNLSLDVAIQNDINIGAVRYINDEMSEFFQEPYIKDSVLSPPIWDAIFGKLRSILEDLQNQSIITNVTVTDDYAKSSLADLVYNTAADVQAGKLKAKVSWFGYSVFEEFTLEVQLLSA